MISAGNYLAEVVDIRKWKNGTHSGISVFFNVDGKIITIARLNDKMAECLINEVTALDPIGRDVAAVWKYKQHIIGVKYIITVDTVVTAFCGE